MKKEQFPECEYYCEIEGKYFKCSLPAPGIVRTHNCCKTHYSWLKKDNLRRVEKGISIPNNFQSLKNPTANILRNCKKEIDKPKDETVEYGDVILEEEDRLNLEVVNGDEDEQ